MIFKFQKPWSTKCSTLVLKQSNWSHLLIDQVNFVTAGTVSIDLLQKKTGHLVLDLKGTDDVRSKNIQKHW